MPLPEPLPFNDPTVLSPRLQAFDARGAAVLGLDTHLPPVPAARLSADALRMRFAHPPPWQPETGTLTLPTQAKVQPVQAAVLIGIVQHAEPTVLLTERAAHLTNHSGQVAFPGGRTDPEDREAADTALREAWEEVGLDRACAEVLGALPVYATGTGFAVTPVVALLHPPLAFVPNPHEVAAVFEVPLAFLMNPAHHRRHRYDGPGGARHWLSMPYASGGAERFVWGATAGMLRNLYCLLAA